VLSGGDDYELCFTLDPKNEPEVMQCARELNLRLTRVGDITETSAIECVDDAGKVFDYSATGYQHF
ncbi:MAG: thiamine-phosphate kinase, partial [Gammaproteobacteria bacterium]